MIDIQKTIFSSKGSYIGIFQESSEIGSGVWIRSLIRPEWGTGRKKLSSKMLKILPYSNNIFTEFHVECEAHVLSFIGDMGHITAIIPNCYTLKLSMANSDLVLEHDNEDLFAAEFTEKKKSFSGYYPICNTKFEIELKNGSYVYNKKSKRVFIRGCRELSIKILRVDLDYSAYREMLTEAEIKNDFERFYASYGLENYHSRLASYILWSGSVMPLGYMKRLTNPISKLKMNMFFSWANCFIAIAQVDSDVELAKSNFLAIVDFQKENGFIYDAVNPVLKVGWFTKPPLYGYFYQKLVLRGVVFSLEEKEALFSTLKRLYLAWEGISGENKICRYVHPWDSGMDNSTAFDNILPISTPDLNVHIITLLQCLSILSAELGLSEESMRFAKTAKNYFHHFMRLSWNGNEFTSVTDSGMQMTSNASCKFIPFILGSLLSKETIEKMKAQLFRDGFVTRWSIATESTRSDKYDTRQGDTFKPSAYWRGPIWPYIVYLVVDGLIGCGEKDTAKDISRRFCDVVEKNCEGIYENYDALSGQGFDDSCDQWTAAVYLIFKADEAKQRLT